MEMGKEPNGNQRHLSKDESLGTPLEEIYQGTITETKNLSVDEFYHSHYQHITNTISDGRSISRKKFLAYNLEMHWNKTHT